LFHWHTLRRQRRSLFALLLQHLPQLTTLFLLLADCCFQIRYLTAQPLQCLLPVLMIGGIQVMPPGDIFQVRLNGFLCLLSELFDPLFHITQGLFLFGEGGTGCFQSAGKPLNLLVFSLRLFL